jgi:uncharacterized SAM-binding protein YcdF (DUF218 family)
LRLAGLKVRFELTWRFTLALAALTVLAVLITRHLWGVGISRSLTCPERLSRSELILVENMDSNYLLFERAAALLEAGFAPRVLIPVQVSQASDRANAATIGVAELMARLAQLQSAEIVPIRAAEPISLNTAYDLREFLTKEHIRRIIVVTSGFRSRRSSLIYESVLAPAGITVSCVPVFIGAGPANWFRTWHGIQEVIEQFLKLQYYRFYVLRVKHAPTSRAGTTFPLSWLAQ